MAKAKIKQFIFSTSRKSPLEVIPKLITFLDSLFVDIRLQQFAFQSTVYFENILVNSKWWSNHQIFIDFISIFTQS